MRGLGLLLAGGLGVALHVVALFLGDLVLGVGLRRLHLLFVLGAGLVLLFELGLRNVLLALGLGVADVLRVGLHAVACGLVGLVLGFDLVLLGLVLVLAHAGVVVGGKCGAGEAEGDGDREGGQLVHGGDPFFLGTLDLEHVHFQKRAGPCPGSRTGPARAVGERLHRFPVRKPHRA